MARKHCSNRTCSATFWGREHDDRGRFSGEGGTHYCSRACQVAARNEDHCKTLRVKVPMSLWHALAREADGDFTPDQLASLLIEEAFDGQA